MEIYIQWGQIHKGMYGAGWGEMYISWGEKRDNNEKENVGEYGYNTHTHKGSKLRERYFIYFYKKPNYNHSVRLWRPICGLLLLQGSIYR